MKWVTMPLAPHAGRASHPPLYPKDHLLLSGHTRGRLSPPLKGLPPRWALSISAFHMEGKLRLRGASTGSQGPTRAGPLTVTHLSPSGPGNTKVYLCDGRVTGSPKPRVRPLKDGVGEGRDCDTRHPDASGPVQWGPVLRPSHTRGSGNVAGWGGMGRTQSSERGQALGRWLVLFLREKRMETERWRNRDLETQGETKRDTEQEQRRRETQRQRNRVRRRTPPHTARERQGEAGRATEKGEQGGCKAASPLRPVPQPGAQARNWGAPTGHCPHVPPPGPSQGTALSEGAHGGAWRGCAVPLSRGGLNTNAHPARGRHPPAIGLGPPLLSGPPFMVIVYAFAC